MTQPATTPTPTAPTDTTTAPATQPTQDPGAAYAPVFNNQVRTAIYILCLIASLVGLGCLCFGQPEIGGFISTAAGAVAGAFGVAYNPVRLAGK